MFRIIDHRYMIAYIVDKLTIQIDWTCTKYLKFLKDKKSKVVGPHIPSQYNVEKTYFLYKENKLLYDMNTIITNVKLNYIDDVKDIKFNPYIIEVPITIGYINETIGNNLFNVYQDKSESKKLVESFLNNKKKIVLKKDVHYITRRRKSNNKKGQLNGINIKRKSSSTNENIIYIKKLLKIKNDKLYEMVLNYSYIDDKDNVKHKTNYYEIIQITNNITLLEPIYNTLSSTKIYLMPLDELINAFKKYQIDSIKNPIPNTNCINVNHFLKWKKHIINILQLLIYYTVKYDVKITDLVYKKENYLSGQITQYLSFVKNNKTIILDIKRFKTNTLKFYIINEIIDLPHQFISNEKVNMKKYLEMIKTDCYIKYTKQEVFFKHAKDITNDIINSDNYIYTG